MYLHSVTWLHKTARSENIVILTSRNQRLDFGAPTIAGFEYARPDLPEEFTEKPAEDLEHDYYRHPDALMSGSRSKNIVEPIQPGCRIDRDCSMATD